MNENIEINEDKYEYRFRCDKCDYKTNKKSSFDTHLNTILHQTGKRGEKKKTIFECNKCEFKHFNKVNYLNHYLNNHGTIEERSNQFKFYCPDCDFGAFADSVIEYHYTSEKHRMKIEIKNLNQQLNIFKDSLIK